MRPLFWGAAAGAATATVLLLVRRARAVSLTPPPSFPGPVAVPKSYGETTTVSLAVPAGWRRISSGEVTPEISAQANALRNTPGFTSMQYGTLSPFVASNGQTYATWIEQHFHPPGGVAQPWGFHHGVTILAQNTANS